METVQKAPETEPVEIDPEAKEAFFKERNESVKVDALGTYYLDMTLEGGSSIDYMVSEWPIHYPSEEELNSGVEGCSSGGYYIDFMGEYSLVIKTQEKVQLFHYVCTYNDDLGSYLVEPSEPSDIRMQSIGLLLSDLESATE